MKTLGQLFFEAMLPSDICPWDRIDSLTKELYERRAKRYENSKQGEQEGAKEWSEREDNEMRAIANNQGVTYGGVRDYPFKS